MAKLPENGSRGFNSTVGAGTTDRIECAGLDSLVGAFTFSAWIRPRVLPGATSMRLFDWRDATEDAQFYIWNDGPTLKLEFDRQFTTNRGIWVMDSPPLTAGEFSHVLLRYDDTNIVNDAELFIDGVLQATFTRAQAPSGTPVTNTKNVFVGNRVQANRGFDGYWHSNAFWASELNDTQVADLAAGENPDSVGTTTLSYLMPNGNTGVGGEVDDSGNGNDGTVTGTTYDAGVNPSFPTGGIVVTPAPATFSLNGYKPAGTPEVVRPDPGNINFTAFDPAAGAGIQYYVATNGNDADPGSITQPFATLDHAMSVALAGATVNMRGGTYAPTLPGNSTTSGTYGNFSNVATAANPITIRNYAGENVILDGNNAYVCISLENAQYINIVGLQFDNYRRHGIYEAGCLQCHHSELIAHPRNTHNHSSGQLRGVNCDTCTFTDCLSYGDGIVGGKGFIGFEFKGSFDGTTATHPLPPVGVPETDWSTWPGYPGSSTNCGFINCIAFDHLQDLGDGDGFLFKFGVDCYCTDCVSYNNGDDAFCAQGGWRCTWTRCIAWDENTGGNNNGFKTANKDSCLSTFVDCIAVDCANDGFDCEGDAKLKMVGNTAIDCLRGYVIVDFVSSNPSAAPGAVAIVNNIGWNNTSQDFWWNTGMSTNNIQDWRNNLIGDGVEDFSQVALQNILSQSPQVVTWPLNIDRNIPTTGPISARVDFIRDQIYAQLGLQASSPCIDAGVQYPPYSRAAFSGSQPDIGALEYVGQGTQIPAPGQFGMSVVDPIPRIGDAIIVRPDPAVFGMEVTSYPAGVGGGSLIIDDTFETRDPLYTKWDTIFSPSQWSYVDGLDSTNGALRASLTNNVIGTFLCAIGAEGDRARARWYLKTENTTGIDAGDVVQYARLSGVNDFSVILTLTKGASAEMWRPGMIVNLDASQTQFTSALEYDFSVDSTYLELIYSRSNSAGSEDAMVSLLLNGVELIQLRELDIFDLEKPDRLYIGLLAPLLSGAWSTEIVFDEVIARTNTLPIGANNQINRPILDKGGEMTMFVGQPNIPGGQTQRRIMIVS